MLPKLRAVGTWRRGVCVQKAVHRQGEKLKHKGKEQRYLVLEKNKYFLREGEDEREKEDVRLLRKIWFKQIPLIQRKRRGGEETWG